MLSQNISLMCAKQQTTDSGVQQFHNPHNYYNPTSKHNKKVDTISALLPQETLNFLHCTWKELPNQFYCTPHTLKSPTAYLCPHFTAETSWTVQCTSISSWKARHSSLEIRLLSWEKGGDWWHTFECCCTFTGDFTKFQITRHIRSSSEALICMTMFKKACGFTNSRIRFLSLCYVYTDDVLECYQQGTD